MDAKCYIDSLPPELLAKTFLSLESSTRLGSGPKRPKWVLVVRVCRRWRQVALGCAELWSHMNFLWPSLIDIQLERSRGFPLSICFEQASQAAAMRKFNEIVSDPGAIIGALSISYHAYNPIDLQESLGYLSAHAPALRDLSIVGFYGTWDTYAGEEIEVPEWYAQLPPSFHMGGAPSLTHLDLVFVEIRWDNIPLGPSITSLRLVPGPDPQGRFRPTTQLFVASICRLPRLEHLTLKLLLPISNDPNGIPHEAPPITFPSLVSLSLTDTASSIKYFLKQFRLSKATTASFEIQHQRGIDAVVLLDECISDVKTFWERGPLQVGWDDLGVEGLAVHPFPEPGYKARDRRNLTMFTRLAYKQKDTAFDANSTPNPWFVNHPHTLSFGFQRHVPIDSKIMGCLERHFDFSGLSRHVVYLQQVARYWNPNPLPTIETTKHICTAYNESLEDITIRGECTLDAALQALSGSAESDHAHGAGKDTNNQASSPGKPYLPALKRLNLVLVGGEEGQDRHSLIAYLKNRPEGYKVEALTFDMSKYLTQSTLTQLRQALPELRAEYTNRSLL